MTKIAELAGISTTSTKFATKMAASHKSGRSNIQRLDRRDTAGQPAFLNPAKVPTLPGATDQPLVWPEPVERVRRSIFSTASGDAKDGVAKSNTITVTVTQ